MPAYTSYTSQPGVGISHKALGGGAQAGGLPVDQGTAFNGGNLHENGGINLNMGDNGKINNVQKGEYQYNFKTGKYIFSNDLKLK